MSASGQPFAIEGYDIQDCLAEGGMGSVYRARQLADDRAVALKLVFFQSLPPNRRAKSWARFRRESLLVLSLDHPNLVRGYDADVIDDVGYLAMEFVEGPSLEQLVERHGALPVEPVLVALDQVAQALLHLEHRGIVHRDVKPANIIVGRGGVAKLCDFGLVRSLDQFTAESDRLTQPDVPLGTIYTMPPEQVTRSHEADVRSDLYSLAASAWWVLTGKPLFDSEAVFDVLQRVVRETPPPVASVRADVDPRLGAVIDQLLHKQPEERLQSAADLRAALEPMLRDLGVDDSVAGRASLARIAGVAPPAGAEALSTRTDPVLSVVAGTVATVSLKGQDVDSARPLQLGESIIVGRSGADVIVPDKWLSRRHCRIELADPGVTVEDLGSANGTHVNGHAVRLALVRNGDEIRVGRTKLAVGVLFKGSAAPTKAPPCSTCGERVPLQSIADGEVIRLDRGFTCPRCRERERVRAFGIERTAMEVLSGLGHEVVGRLGQPGSASPTFEVVLREGEARRAAARVVRCGDAAAAAAVAARVRGAARLRFNTILPTIEVRTVGELVLLLSEVSEGWRALAAQMAAAGGKLPPGKVARAGFGVARALEAGLKAGIMHGDVTPETVFVAPGGQVAIAGFGIGIGPETRATRLEAGTDAPCYLAPELVGTDRPVDVKSEAYGFGATLFHALVGEPPARIAPDRELLLLPDRASALRSVRAPRQLKEVIERTIDPDPEKRPSHFNVVNKILRELATAPEKKQGSQFIAYSPGLKGEQTQISGDDTARLSRSELRKALGISGDLIRLAKEIGACRRTGTLAVVSRGETFRLAVREGRLVGIEPARGDPGATAIKALGDANALFEFREGDPGGAGERPLGNLATLAQTAQALSGE